ncbi:hypothetical protein [Streptomyces neyagawaensis]|uniref:Uncharacterized protein n=1 Tax=Streptomyces neyagawaensis TaxID=42238 RepID=A0ABV3AW50_9ACTN
MTTPGVRAKMPKLCGALVGKRWHPDPHPHPHAPAPSEGSR